jgi:hypothetical protein
MLAHPTLFEMLAPSQQGPVYMRLVTNGNLLKIGGEFNLNAAQVDAWIAILEVVQERIKRSD